MLTCCACRRLSPFAAPQPASRSIRGCGSISIVEDPSTARKDVQVYQNDGKQLQVKAKGSSVCDLTSIGGPKRSMDWDVAIIFDGPPAAAHGAALACCPVDY
jgi:hypothetical protein